MIVEIEMFPAKPYVAKYLCIVPWAIYSYFLLPAHNISGFKIYIYHYLTLILCVLLRKFVPINSCILPLLIFLVFYHLVANNFIWGYFCQFLSIVRTLYKRLLLLCYLLSAHPRNLWNISKLCAVYRVKMLLNRNTNPIKSPHSWRTKDHVERDMFYF